MQLQRFDNPLAATTLGVDVKEDSTLTASNNTNAFHSGVLRGGGGFKPPSEIPKALQNCAKLNPICENC